MSTRENEEGSHGVVFGGIVPHPPLLVPEVGKGELVKVVKTSGAMRELGYRLANSGAELLIIITPHGPLFRDAISVSGGDVVTGDFGKFGAGDVKLTFRNDVELRSYLEEGAQKANIPLEVVVSELDHGAAVPLHYFEKQGVDLPGLIITYGLLPYEKTYAFGKVIRRAAARRGLKTAIVASGDLSHRLLRGAPAGYSPRGQEYDDLLIKLLSDNRIDEILNMDQTLVEDAGECALRSIVMSLGFLYGLDIAPEILSYEGPFGVGYMVASLNPERDPDGVRKAITSLARRSIEGFLERGEVIVPDEDLPPELVEFAGGVFVTLKRRGQLRGCIGTIEPTHENIAGETINNAISAGFKDPRFPQLHPRELKEIDISVDVLSMLEPVSDPSELDPRKYGVVVRHGPRSGLLLPDLEGVNTVQDQLNIALQKARISPKQPYEIFRFTVTRYPE
ncbi:MAG: AmmeMemoRadiSam system protein A [Firmicutes bacterium]|nr:AmmeMemoRadiSam system protein A [Bacillota bacterium]